MGRFPEALDCVERSKRLFDQVPLPEYDLARLALLFALAGCTATPPPPLVPSTPGMTVVPKEKQNEVVVGVDDDGGARALGRERGLEYTIGRSADFYGPGATTSSFNMMVLDRVAAEQDPTWLIDKDQPHSMTYTPDIGLALATLGTDPRARGQVWHLPTARARTAPMSLMSATNPSSVAVIAVTSRIRTKWAPNTQACWKDRKARWAPLTPREKPR